MHLRKHLKRHFKAVLCVIVLELHEKFSKLSNVQLLILVINRTIKYVSIFFVTGVFTHYTSFIPFQFKLGLRRTLFDRAYKIYSTWSLFHLEMENIVRMLSLNGYNKNFIYSVIEKELNKRLCNEPKLVTEGPD